MTAWMKRSVRIPWTKGFFMEFAHREEGDISGIKCLTWIKQREIITRFINLKNKTISTYFS